MGNKVDLREEDKEIDKGKAFTSDTYKVLAAVVYID